jgi:hypothetical protein
LNKIESRNNIPKRPFQTTATTTFIVSKFLKCYKKNTETDQIRDEVIEMFSINR